MHTKTILYYVVSYFSGRVLVTYLNYCRMTANMLMLLYEMYYILTTALQWCHKPERIVIATEMLITFSSLQVIVASRLRD